MSLTFKERKKKLCEDFFQKFHKKKFLNPRSWKISDLAAQAPSGWSYIFANVSCASRNTSPHLGQWRNIINLKS